MSTAFPLYLAMTAQEFETCLHMPDHPAWMACQFSPSGKGLSNIPRNLPEGSLLILNDRMPYSDHDPQIVRRQLFDAAVSSHSGGILLDLLRPPNRQTLELCQFLCQDPPCPVGIPEAYWQKDLCAPVFLSPVPLLTPLHDYLIPWKGETVWLELSLEEKIITLSADRATEGGTPVDPALPVHTDDSLHCAYRIAVEQDRAILSLFRTPETLCSLMAEAESLGIALGIGLYQELYYGKNPQT